QEHLRDHKLRHVAPPSRPESATEVPPGKANVKPTTIAGTFSIRARAGRLASLTGLRGPRFQYLRRQLRRPAGPLLAFLTLPWRSIPRRTGRHALIPRTRRIAYSSSAASPSSTR